MSNNRFATSIMLLTVLTMGLLLGLNLSRGGNPAFAQPAMGPGPGTYAIEEIQSVDEKDDHYEYEGRTLAIVTPSGELKLVRINWQRQRGEDEDFPKHYAAAASTYKVEMLDATADLR